MQALGRALCASVALIASTTSAATRVSLTSASDGTVYTVDLDSLRKEGSFAQAWIKADYSKVRSERDREVKQLYRFNCDKQTIYTLSVIRYAASGDVTYSRSQPDNPYAYDPVAPDTVGDAMLSGVCGR